MIYNLIALTLAFGSGYAAASQHPVWAVILCILADGFVEPSQRR